MKFVSYDIVFQEIPHETTLAINISNCPNRCKGCHSPHLQQDTGEPLNENVLTGLLQKYGNAITCVCFMGGDGEPEEVLRLAVLARKHTKTAWYSGKNEIYENAQHYFDYIKIGNYNEELGGLNSPTTNQRLYRIESNEMIDITQQFYKR